ncbi:MAG: zinc-binding alcohol dehydrogenase [Pseudomonadota bacterium]|nr:zinc-binding alcohol dehydrogenase [Pseudomonadota bacterium]MEE3100941.1 zinc-binding alcohol dehydrogenase [Pseudomonadota bacterium]
MPPPPRALHYVAPRRAEIRDADPGEGACLLRMVRSAISRGTERLVFEGRVPVSEQARMRAPFQTGEFPFPVKYGYCAVAEVLEGPDALRGRLVFALHPHQDRFRLPAAALHPLPAGLTPRLGALAANMETALNVVWDSGAGPGDRVAVVGAGLVGCLVARLVGRIPGTQVTLCDRDPSRAAAASALGVGFALPDALGEGGDVAVHASASQEGLATALGCLGVEGRLIEASWFGDAAPAVPLGGAFHARRLSIVSSQVGRIPAARAARWDFARRLRTALDLLAGDPGLEAALLPPEAEDVPFDALPGRLPDLLAPDAPGVATLVAYP